VDGYSIASIEWSEKVGETKVTISKDGKFATLTFNQALLSQAASAGAPTADQMQPSVPLIPRPGARQASRAHSRGVIQRNPKATPAPASTPNPVPKSTPNPEPAQVISQQEQLLQEQQQWQQPLLLEPQVPSQQQVLPDKPHPHQPSPP
jgi:hypothetical protein